MAEGFRLRWRSGSCTFYTIQYLVADLLERQTLGDDGTGIDVHVVLHVLISGRIGAYLDDGGYGAASHGASPSSIEY